MSKTFVLHISWVDFFFALCFGFIQSVATHRVFFLFRLTSNHDWIWIVATIKTTRKEYELMYEPKPLESISFFFFRNELSSKRLYIFWQSLTYTKEEPKKKIPENGRRTTFLPPSYQLCSIYSERWFLFSCLPFLSLKKIV